MSRRLLDVSKIWFNSNMLAGVTFLAGVLYARDISKLCLNDLYGVIMTGAVIFESGLSFWVFTYLSVVDVCASQGSARKFVMVSSKKVNWLPWSISAYVSKALVPLTKDTGISCSCSSQSPGGDGFLFTQKLWFLKENRGYFSDYLTLSFYQKIVGSLWPFLVRRFD